MSLKKHFKLGEIVTLKSHPLFRKDKELKIKELNLQVPPLMLVKEVHFENKKQKKVFSEETENAQISDLVKYVCVYFCAAKSQFEEKTIFHSFLKPYKKLHYYYKNEEGVVVEDIELIKSVKLYNDKFEYRYGKLVQFKTKVLEYKKAYKVNNESLKNSSFQTLDFVLTGTKKELQKESFYPNGEKKRIITTTLYKVMWFNYVQQKFSEQYLPKEFFVKGLKI